MRSADRWYSTGVPDALDELIDACEIYIANQFMLLQTLRATPDTEAVYQACLAELDQLVTAVEWARKHRPAPPPRRDPGE